MKPKELEQLRLVIESVVDNMVKQAGLKMDKAARNDFVQKTLSALTGNGKDQRLTPEMLRDRNTIKEMITSVATALTLKQSDMNNELNGMLDMLRKDPEFMKEFTKIMESPENGKGERLENLLKKHFENKPDMLKNLQRGLKDLSDKLLKETQKTLNPGKDALEPKVPGNDLYSNLFGLIASGQTGGHQIPVPQFVGNGFGFNDWNPNDGCAPIDAQNSINDTQFGDSLGLNALAVRSYLSVPEASVDAFTSLLDSVGLSPAAENDSRKAKTPFKTTLDRE